jgi:ABC-type Na+ efflux pump permease subunit
MQLGLFLRRALITFVRRGTVFKDRVAAVIMVVAVVAGCILFWDRLGWERTTIAGAALFGLSTFGLLVGILTVIAMSLFYARATPSIASERDRKSLDSLLATPLSSAEIVVGMMVTGLVRSANWLVATVPVVVLVAIAGGVPPLLVLLTTAGLGSSLFAAAALAVAGSAYAPNRNKAGSVGIGLLIAWFDLPLFGELFLLRVWPGSPRWLVQVQHWLVDSSPAGVGMSAFLPTLVPRPFGLIEALLRMIALQVCGASLLVLWAAWQLRPASRALYDGDWPVLTRWVWRATRLRPRPRQPCGDDSVLWNELHSLRASSLAGRVVAGLGQLVGIGVLALGTSWFALPAFAELAERGFGVAREGLTMPEVNPLARVLVGKLLLPAGSVAPGQARLEFNIALRQFSALFVMLYVVMACGTAAMSMILERERDTWHSLIATSLTAWEILRAKMLAAIWRARAAGLMLITLWTVGLLAGAVHPLGILNAVAGLIVIGAFYAVVGVSLSLRIGERKQIESIMILFILGVLPMSGLAIMLPGTASVFLGACSTPFLIWSSLFSYEDVQSVVRSGVFAQLGGTGIKPGVSARMVLAACWVATIVHGVGAIVLMRMTCRRFDALVGRPVRSSPVRVEFGALMNPPAGVLQADEVSSRGATLNSQSPPGVPP